MRGLAGRTVVVTGGAQGIGAAIATRLADEGMRVAILDLSGERCALTVENIETLGGEAASFVCDVADEASVEETFGAIVAEFQTVDMLVNNAGITRDALLFKMSVQDWDVVMGVHLRGAFLCTRAAQRSMVAQKFGKIVNVSSTAALGNRGQSNYSAAKAGVQGLTKTMAIELGKYNINVNAVAPGFIVTDMTRAAASANGQDFDSFTAEAVSRIALGRPGYPEDVANVTSYLLSEDASFLTGQVLYVTGQPRI